MTNSCGTFTSNSISITISGTCSTGLKFDGITDYAKIPHHASLDFGNGNFTIEAWVNLDVNQTAIYPTLISNRYQSSPGYWIYFVNGRLNVYIYPYTRQVGPDLRDNTCHHIAISRSSTFLTSIYIDGILAGTQTSTTAGVSVNSSILIGSDFYYSGTAYPYLKGNIMEVRLWNISRSQADIQNTRNIALTGTSPASSGITGWMTAVARLLTIIHQQTMTGN
jgi:hypothetical protein